jgi:UDP-N-acetyl-D-mannosaminuronic acid transferase (WecB/TagA/CpsF family)
MDSVGWHFGLASEPRRLWKRRLLKSPRYVSLVQQLGLKRFPLESAGKEKEG